MAGGKSQMELKGRLCETGGRVTVAWDAGRIVSVGSPGDGAAPDLGGDDVWVAPGFIDLQVNGYGGDDFCGAASPEAIARIAGRLAKAGTPLFCPTVCTQSFDSMRASLEAIARAGDEDESLARAIPGIHVEGPYFAEEDGPRGAHPREHVRDPSWDEFLRFRDAAGGRIKIVTLAPERNGALPFIERAAASGIVVSIGHTGASPERIREAVKAGARMSTHLGNGAHALLPRHPNYIWEQLACDDLYASVIADGHHLPPSVLKAMARVKGPERLCLVSDAVTLGGLAPGLYDDGRHEVLPSGKVALAGTPYLAGAGHLLDTCVANALRFTDLGMRGIAQTAAANPAEILGLAGRKGRVAPGFDADLTLFRLPAGEGPIEVVATVRGGAVVYRG